MPTPPIKDMARAACHELKMKELDFTKQEILAAASSVYGPGRAKQTDMYSDMRFGFPALIDFLLIKREEQLEEIRNQKMFIGRENGGEGPVGSTDSLAREKSREMECERTLCQNMGQGDELLHLNLEGERGDGEGRRPSVECEGNEQLEVPQRQPLPIDLNMPYMKVLEMQGPEDPVVETSGHHATTGGDAEENGDNVEAEGNSEEDHIEIPILWRPVEGNERLEGAVVAGVGSMEDSGEAGWLRLAYNWDSDDREMDEVGEDEEVDVVG